MHRNIRSALLLVLFLLVGCTKPERYAEVMREQREAYQETVDILVKVQDEKSMAEAKPALDRCKERFEQIVRKAKALPPPSSEVLQRYETEQYLVKSSWERYRDEANRIRQLKGGPEFLKQFETNSQSLFQAVQP